MSLQQHYLQTAVRLLSQYEAPMPFAIYLKKFFGLHKKYGSRDRKIIASLCYAFLRLCWGWDKIANEKFVAEAHWLLTDDAGQLSKGALPEPSTRSNLAFPEKAALLSKPVSIEDWFPFAAKIGSINNKEGFLHNLLRSQSVFIRLRPGYKQRILHQLQNKAIAFDTVADDVVSFAPNAPIDRMFELDKELVVQDFASRKTGIIIGNHVREVFNEKPVAVWDVCAASGGKSIMLADDFEISELYCTDIRNSILQNLRKRFASAGISNYQAMVADVSKGSPFPPAQQFELVLCDVPCSGSGTWARTPEQIFSYDEKIIEYYSVKQQAICINAIKHVKPGGLLVYITCSVFHMENEAQVKRLMDTGLKCLQQLYIEGSEHKADTMFCAIFQNASIGICS